MALSKILPASQEQYAGARNLIINGAMQVAARGVSFTDSDTYSLDRWRLNASSETMAVTQQSFTVGQTDVPRAEKYLRVVVTTTGNFAGIGQRIEGVEQLSGQTVTLSFYARGGQGGQGVPTTFRTYLNQNFGSGGSTAVNVQNSTNHTLTTSWQKFTATLTLGSVSGKTIGTSPYTEVVFQQTTGEACDFDLALVQLEVGEATPFEHRSYADELARCQRYYYRHADGGDTSTASVGTGTMFSATTVMCAVSFPVRMRATPALDHLNATSAYRIWRNGSSDYFNNFNAFYDAHPLGGAIQADSNISGTAGHGGRIVLGGSAAYIAFDAEL